MPSAFDSISLSVQSQLDGLQTALDRGLPSVLAAKSGNLTSVKLTSVKTVWMLSDDGATVTPIEVG